MSTLLVLADTYTLDFFQMVADIMFVNDVERILIYHDCSVNTASSCRAYDQKSDLFIKSNDLKESISECDYIVISTTYISEYNRDFIQQLAMNYRKPIIEIYDIDICPIVNNKLVDSPNYPSILIIAIGNCSQHTSVEMMLLKAIHDLQIFCNYVPSSSAASLINVLSKTGLLNSSFFTKGNDDANTISLSVCELESISELRKKAIDISSASPDIVILCTDIDPIDVDFVKNFLYYACSIKLDMVIKSHYHSVNKENRVYCAKEIEQDLHYLFDVESPFLEGYIKDLICRKLSFPEGITPV